MLIGQAIILGIIQGLTEFLPVSSSGHLIIIPHIFHWSDQGLFFDVWLHLGTLLAVLFYFRTDLKQIILSFLKPNKRNYPWRKFGFYLIIATIPAGIFGILSNDRIATVLRNTTVVSFSLIFWAVILWLAENYSEKYSSHKTELVKINFWQVLAVGFWQVIALIPGTSRSGITATGGMLVGLNKRLALRFSFLLSIPIIAAAGLFSFLEMTLKASQLLINWNFILTGFLSSFVSGYLAIIILMKVVEKWGFKPFVVYRIILALIIIFFI